MQAARRHAPLLGLATLAALTLAPIQPAAAQATYTFEDQTPNPAGNTPFSDTQNGLTATFTTTPHGRFDYAQVAVDGIGSPEFHNMSGNVLVVQPGDALNIGFSQELSSVFLDFGTQGYTGTPITLSAYSNGVFVGSTTQTGTGPGGVPGYYDPGYTNEGTFSFTGAAFNSITLSPTSPAQFAIDNVTATPTPEPSSVAAFAFTGLGALGLILKARKRPAA